VLDDSRFKVAGQRKTAILGAVEAYICVVSLLAVVVSEHKVGFALLPLSRQLPYDADTEATPR